ncbi:MAG: hypothetical protein WCR52_20615 [Bacteroidota bacterium]
MKQIQTIFFLLCAFGAQAQVTFNGVGNLPIPPGAPAQTMGITQSNCAVTGIGVLGGCATIDNVTIDVQHTWVGDIGIFLIGPGGQVLEFSTGNGLGGDNFTNTVFSDNAATFITSGTPPFTGTFKPEGRITNLLPPYSNGPALGTYTFANTYNGTNADGNWILYINDYVPLDVGILLSWSITFNTGGTPPDANAGPDVSICSTQSTTLTATGGGTYSWSNGATTASTTVSPTTTTTYTVTVTSPGCGTDTDEVVVTANPTPTVSLSVANNNVCNGDCGTLQANLSGTPPFQFTWQFQVAGSAVGSNQSVSGGSSPISFQACPPPGSNGAFQVVICTVSDAFCTN